MGWGRMGGWIGGGTNTEEPILEQVRSQWHLDGLTRVGGGLARERAARPHLFDGGRNMVAEL